MKDSAYRAALFALYQASIATGIALLPVALLARRLGIHIPAGRLVASLGDAYESARSSA